MRQYINIVEAAEAPEHLQHFHKLADAQRGAPELAMLDAQKALRNLPSGPALGHALEHVGDLTHRMAQRHCERMNYGREYVEPKVRTGLSVVTNPVDREHMDRIPDLPELAKYADAHAKLPVYNEAQYHAREAAVNLGRKNFGAVEKHLMKLKAMLDDGSYETIAAEYRPNALNEMKVFRRENNRFAGYGNTSEFTFYQHASPDELFTLCQKAGSLRGIVTPPDFGEVLVWWKANDGLHIDACEALGVPGGSSSDEDRRNKVGLRSRNGEIIVECHVSRLTHPEVKKLLEAGARAAAYER